MSGGCSDVGALVVDFKIFKRDLKSFIGGGDAQMIVNYLTEKKSSDAGFSFEHYINEEGVLSQLFFADKISMKDCNFFADVVSFDATYRTNKYNMGFVPFTGVDNHRRSVIVAAWLISNENINSYIWLLTCFKNLLSEQPKIIITDQDAAMKAAIAQVFDSSYHRFCMWHIAEKLKAKLKYSHTIFFKEIEVEIEADVYKRSIEEELKDGDIRLYTIKERDQTRSNCQVSFAISSSNAVCSCNKFQSFGIICRHIFHVLNSYAVERIPKCLIMKRWCKEALNLSETETSMDSSSILMQSSLVSEIWSEFQWIVQLVKDDEEKMKILLESVKNLHGKFHSDKITDKSKSKSDFFSSILGIPQPTEVNIQVPKVARNKGRGKRLKTTREICIQESKQKRLCTYCGMKAPHDKRNCPLKFADQEVGASAACQRQNIVEPCQEEERVQSNFQEETSS
ncbi:hypothetical protein QQ045_023669 [Rhodiola kirilowii]